MIQWLHKMATEHIKSISPLQRATDDFVRYGDLIHRTLTWTGGCRSWYKNHRVDGRVTATWPGSALLYKKVVERIRPEDFEIEWWSEWGGGNRFAGVMGDGFLEIEKEERDGEVEGKGEGQRGEVDLAWYIEVPD